MYKLKTGAYTSSRELAAQDVELPIEIIDFEAEQAEISKQIKQMEDEGIQFVSTVK